MRSDSPFIYCGSRTISRRAFTLVEVMVGVAVFALALLAGLTAIIFALQTVDAARTSTQVTQILLNEMESMRMRGWLYRDIGATPGAHVVLGYGYDSTISSALDRRYSLAAPFAGGGYGDANLERKSVALSSMPKEVRAAVARYMGEGKTVEAIAATGFIESTFYPFAVYGVPPESPSSTHPVAQLGTEVAKATSVKLRSMAPYVCRRYVARFTPKAESGTTKPSALVVLYVSWKDAHGVHVRVFPTVITSNGIHEKIIND